MKPYRKIFTNKNAKFENYIFVYNGEKYYIKINDNQRADPLIPLLMSYIDGQMTGFPIYNEPLHNTLMKLLIRYGKMQILEDCLSGNKLALFLRDKYL